MHVSLKGNSMSLLGKAAKAAKKGYDKASKAAKDHPIPAGVATSAAYNEGEKALQRKREQDKKKS